MNLRTLAGPAAILALALATAAPPAAGQTRLTETDWRADLSSPDPAVREAAVRRSETLALFPANRSAALRAMREDADPGVRAALARELLSRGDQISQDWPGFARDRDPRVRAAAAAALPVARLGSFGLEALVTHLEDPDPSVRAAAARNLSGFWTTRGLRDTDFWARLATVLERIAARLRDPAIDIRLALVNFFGEGLVTVLPDAQRTAFRQHLATVLADPADSVAATAALHLARTGAVDLAVRLALFRVIPAGGVRQIEALDHLERVGIPLFSKETPTAKPAEALAALLDDPNESLRVRALILLHRCGAGGRVVAPAVARAFRNGSSEVRQASLDWFRRFPEEAQALVSELKASLPGASGDYRQDARELLALAAAGGPGAFFAAGEEGLAGPALQDPDPRVRRAAAEAFGRSSFDWVARERALQPALADPAPQVRAAAVASLLGAYTAQKTLYATCKTILADPDPEVRIAALLAVRTIDGDEVALARLYLDQLASAHADVRRVALERLREHSPAAWQTLGVDTRQSPQQWLPSLRVEPVLATVCDSDASVRFAAVEFLGTCVSFSLPRQSQPLVDLAPILRRTLQQALGDVDGAVRAVAAFHETLRAGPVPEGTIESALSAGHDAKDPLVRARMIEIVGAFRFRAILAPAWAASPARLDRAVEFLGRAVEDDDDRVRHAAMRALVPFYADARAAGAQMVRGFRTGSRELRLEIIALLTSFPEEARPLEPDLDTIAGGSDELLKVPAAALLALVRGAPNVPRHTDASAPAVAPGGSLGSWIWAGGSAGVLALILVLDLTLRRRRRRDPPAPATPPRDAVIAAAPAANSAPVGVGPLPAAAFPSTPASDFAAPVPAAAPSPPLLATRRWVRNGRGFTSRSWEGRGADTEIEARLDHPLLPHFQVLPRGSSTGVELLPVVCRVATGIAEFDQRFEVRLPSGSAGALPPVGEAWLQILLVANLCRRPGLVLEANGAVCRCRLLGGIAQEHQRVAVFHQVCRILEMVLHRYDVGAPVLAVEVLVTEPGAACAEVVCRVCGDAIGETPLRCARCGTPHHRECWEYAGKCSIFGCGSAESREV